MSDAFAVLYDDADGTTKRLGSKVYADSYEAADDAREFFAENPDTRNVRVVPLWDAES